MITDEQICESLDQIAATCKDLNLSLMCQVLQLESDDNVTMEKVYIKDIIHTHKSKKQMNISNLSEQDVVNAINKNSKISENKTIFCNGCISVRLVEYDDKYLVIDVYKNTLKYIK